MILSYEGSARMVFLSCGTEGVWGVDNRGIVYLRIGVKAPERRHPGALNPAWVPIDGTPHGAGAKFNKVFAGPSDWMVGVSTLVDCSRRLMTYFQQNIFCCEITRQNIN